MAQKEKKPQKSGVSLQGFDASHYKQTESYVQAIDMLYNQAIGEFARLAAGIPSNPNKPFSFADYPATKNLAQGIINGLASKMQAVIVKGSRDQWLYACKKNDEFLNRIMNTSKVPKKILSKYQDRNLDALDSFQKRKSNGMDLSNRVWNYAGQMKKQMELGIDVAIGEGKSAAQLARDLKGSLVDPDKLFRRVRDKRGNLHLSKNADAFHPGQGKYRSSYKNSMRLTRSEINMAYRQADQLRWMQLDFVVGYEIRLSNNHTILVNGVPTPFEDICDDLAGRYPKTFVFKGWHPQCRCQLFPILMNPKEFNMDEEAELRAALRGTEYKKYQSSNEVQDVPQNFKDWVDNNLDRSKGWASPPYFVKENFKGGTLSGGLSLIKPTIAPPQAPNASTQPLKPIVPSTPKAQPKPIETISKNMPSELGKGSAYLNGKQIEFKKDFFDLLDSNKPVSLRIESRGRTSYFRPTDMSVHIVNDQRNMASPWHRESVIYHEYGHAIDQQRGLKYSSEVRAFMESSKTLLKQRIDSKVWEAEYKVVDGNFKTIYVKKDVRTMQIADAHYKLTELHRKISRMSPDVFKRRGITKQDVTEQICSVMDTIMSMNSMFGYGHTKSYYKTPGMKEAEFLAHCFENAYVGNPVFKKYLPDLYEDMIKYVKALKPIQ